MVRERNAGLDLLRFLAAIFVTNSHLDICYGDYAFLATGGTIGDVLFFFCSGYTLFMKPVEGGIKSFPNWYKRRFNRIFPSIFAVAMISCIVKDDLSGRDIFDILTGYDYWFIQCIMLYYVLIYFIGCYFKFNLLYIYALLSLVTLGWFLLIEKEAGYSMYHPGSLIKWCPYFLFMVMGAQLGRMRLKITTNDKKSLLGDFLKSMIGIGLFYIFLAVGVKYEQYSVVQVFSFLPLLYGIYKWYEISQHSQVESFVNKYNFVIRFIGGLCLEIYLIGDFIITDKLNHLFPLNIPILLGGIVIGAYLLRCLARFYSQSFKDEPYDWKAMVSLI